MITFTVDLARYTDNELYNMLTSGTITRDEYRAELALREQLEREQMGEVDREAAADRAYNTWKASRFD